MEKLNLNSLRVFATAARHGNFQRAAEMLHISNGAVSQRIKQLEADLGVVLFDRKPRGVALTEKGRTYYSAVQEALSILAVATSDLGQSSRQIRLHIGASSAAKWLMPRMSAFNARFPEISLETEIHDTMLERNLGRNEIALWPARAPVHNSAHHVQCLCELQLVAVCSPDFLRPDWPVDTQALLAFPLLQDAHRRWERLVERTGYDGGHSILNFGRSALALDAAIQSHGVAIAPTFMIEADVRARRLVEIWRNPDPSGEYFFLSWPKQYAHENPLRQTVTWILSEFGIDTAADT
ncbi:LysR substrate-binding domain-containing protein [Roseinatronobacter alkalisoli]|uniref:LysR substrate-binding domain-containing protein n=1 Tax=Roseinatronobacter alkalisoli TaxID=3028235 RepID=A0ABT5T4A8_9RHOB|nr:LysR substrate-binding domain-containing protein [Roseinatronobacter sp. HJB301]MDD7969953.1 LysR substrate-binding domain-containing protein [Roseinatronobacter sp. HJB301]